MGKYFGTDGFRGVANDVITSQNAYRIGRMMGQYPNGRHNKVLIARDTRLSGGMISSALASGLAASGSEVIDIGVSVTASVAYLLKIHNCDYGIVVSASHNPFYDNGIKIFNKDAEKIDAELELLLETYIDEKSDNLPYPFNEQVGKVLHKGNYKDIYIDFLASLVNVDPSEKMNIVVDCANGSAYKQVKNVFNRFPQLNCIYINDAPNGININRHCGSTHLSSLKEKLHETKYDIGFAFDGDCDRLIVVNKDGRELDGDGIIYLCAKHLKSLQKLNKNAVVLTTMSNIGTKKALKNIDIDYIISDVGDKNVQNELKKNMLSLGGEQSGHITFMEHLNTGDGILSMIKVLNALSYFKITLDDVLKEWVKFPQVLLNVKVSNKQAVLLDSKLKEMIDKYQQQLGNNGRVFLRASGTEQLIRIMCEADSEMLCNSICENIKNYINDLNF